MNKTLCEQLEESIKEGSLNSIQGQVKKGIEKEKDNDKLEIIKPKLKE